MRMASATLSERAPPPISRKLAGWPPARFTRSIVVMASPAPLTMQPMSPSSRMKLSPASARLDVGGVLLVEVAHGLVPGMPRERRIVERDLGVQERQALDRARWSGLPHDRERIDLDEVGIGRDHEVVEAPADGDRAGEMVTEAERESHLACLEGLQAEQRVGVDPHDG